MAVSRAAVLQSLVLDESLRQYQAAAVNTVQNLASAFTGVAHALQKQKVQTSHVEGAIQKQINAMALTINEQAAVIEDLRAAQERWAARYGDAGPPVPGAQDTSSNLAVRRLFHTLT
jgi:septation ring formation regulator EzrA